MSEQVECYSGSVYPERPTALHWQGQRLEIVQVLGAWHTPLGRRFRVQTADLQLFELLYRQAEDDWQISHLTSP
jgi:hypothetical protein